MVYSESHMTHKNAWWSKGRMLC